MTDPTIKPKSAADIIMDLIVSFLAPMFLSASGGNLGYARAAAIETVNAYRTQTQADLLSVAQIIAFGLAALGSLSLSMADNISLSMTLRLRGNAVALNRAAEQSRRALAQNRYDTAPPEAPLPVDDGFPAEAEIAAGVRQVLNDAAAAQARLRQTRPAPASKPSRIPEPIIAPAPISPARTTIAPISPARTTIAPISDEERRTIWAKAMAEVAAEVTAGMPDLPPAERRVASIRAAALSSTASGLLAGENGRMPSRLDLGIPMNPATQRDSLAK